MQILLDTCALIWLGKKQSELSQKTLDLVIAKDTEVFVSAVSIMELACLQTKKRIDLGKPFYEWWQEMLATNGWWCLSVTAAIAKEAYRLPEPFHRDPADRLLVATARIEDMPLVTGDSLILSYPHVKTLP